MGDLHAMATFLREKEERLDTLQHQYEELIRELQAIKSGSSLTEQQVMDLSVENKGLKKRLREAQASNFFWTALFLILTVTSIVCYSVVSHASGGQPSAIVEIFEVLSALSLGCCGAWAWGVWYGK